MKKSINVKLMEALSNLITDITNEAITMSARKTIDPFIIDSVFSAMEIYDTTDFDNEIYERAKEMFPNTNFESEYEDEDDFLDEIPDESLIFTKKQAD